MEVIQPEGRESTVRKTGMLLLFPLLIGCSAQLADDAQKCRNNITSNPDLALRGCTALIESGKLSKGNLVKVLVDRGVAYTNKGDYESAVQDFDKAIRLSPDVAEAFMNRGIAYDNKGAYDRAIQDYNQAIQLRPDYAPAFNNRGIVYSEKREYDRAIQDFDQAIRLKSGYADPFENRGDAYAAKGNYDRAIQDDDLAVQLYGPQDPHILATRGVAASIWDSSRRPRTTLRTPSAWLRPMLVQ